MKTNLQSITTRRLRSRRLAPGRTNSVRLTPVALAWALCLAVPAGMSGASAQALPSGAATVQGQASITTQGNRMTVTSSSNAILNWQSFSIGAGQSVRFDQPTSSSQVLNRVLGNDPSHIFGQLSSNGRVWLLNPNGVLFGPTARVDVAGLVASTLNISDTDWQTQRYHLLTRELGPAGGGAAVVNQGELRSTWGGKVMLIGGPGGVRNEGLIEAPGGQVLLAAGQSVELTDSTMPDIAVRVSAPQGQVLNLGRIAAGGGRVDLQGAMVNQSGIVRADAIGSGAGGEIVLRSTDTTWVSGETSATAAAGTGGTVQLLGPQVGLLDGARVDVSGSRGGGAIHVGGGRQGQDAAIPNSRAVYLAAGATLVADATDHGPGGSIVLWSDQATRAYGRLSARGGASGGDGGFIETSGGWLDARPASVRTDAPLGRGGRWLLDPNNILITGSGSDTNVTGGPDFSTTDDSAVLADSTIVAALNLGNNVTVTTASLGGNSQAGDIHVSGANIAANPSSGVSLTLTADRNIDVSGSTISSSGGSMDLILSAGRSTPGGITVSGSSILVQGTVKLGGTQVACSTAGCAPFAGAVGYNEAGRYSGVVIAGSSLHADRIEIAGATGVGVSSQKGVSIDASTSLQARDIDIKGWAGGPGTSPQIGLYSAGSMTATRSMSLEGTNTFSGSGGSELNLVGVLLDSSSSTQVTPSGNNPASSLRIVGRSDPRLGSNDASIYAAGALLATGSSKVDLVGDGGDVVIDFSAAFDTASAGSLTFKGSAFVLVAADMLVPTAGPFSVVTDKGVYFQEGNVTGSPSSVLFDAPQGSVEIGGSFATANLAFGSAPVTVNAGRFEMGTSSGIGSLSAGRIVVRSSDVLLDLGTSGITSSASGDALTFAGLTGNMPKFINLAGSGALSAPNGRWRLFATDPRDSANFDSGGLDHDFTQYNAIFGESSTKGSGHGLFFSLAPKLVVTAPSTAGVVKPYDGTTDVTTGITASDIGLTGLLPGDQLAGSLSVSKVSYSDANVGKGISLDVDFKTTPSVEDSASRPVYGYGLSNPLIGSIVPRSVSATSASFADKAYDGTTVASLSRVTFSGLVGGEELSFKPGTASFDTKDVGNDKPVAGSVVLADGVGGLASNYVLSSGGTVSGKASITPRPLTISGLTVTPKLYDGNTTATVTGASFAGLVANETLLAVPGPGQFDTKDVGSGKAVTAPVTLADGAGASAGRASNYMLVDPVGVGQGDITPKTVTVTGVTADSKVYDGTTSASLSGGSFVGLVGTETLTLARTGVFDTKDAGIGKTVTATLSLADGSGGGKASNYALPGAGQVTTTADITPRPLTVSGLTAVTREYDGTRNVTLAGTGGLSGLVGTETLGFSLGSGLFDTKDAGVDKTISASLVLSDGSNGGKASNYLLPAAGSATFTGTILPKSLAISGVTAADKVYDGNTEATVSVASVSGFVSGETVVVQPAGTFADKNVGTAKKVSVTLSLQDGSGGGLAGNYVLGSKAATTVADITRRPVTVSGVVAQDKVYDATLVATLSAGSVAGLVPGEALTVSGTATFGDKNVGSGKAVTGTIQLADGPGGQAANYLLSSSSAFGGNAAIQPRPVSLASATAADKVYDGNTTAAVSGLTLAGVLPGEQVTVSASNGRFADPNVGNGKPVTATATALGGADAGNYTLGAATFGTSATITPATLTYLATPAVRPVGGAISDLTGSVSGFIGGESLATATSGVASFGTPAGASSPEGYYPIFGSGLSARNYVFGQASANATALALLKLPTGLTGDVGSQSIHGIADLAMLTLPTPVLSSPGSNRAADALQTVVGGSSSGATFRSVDLASLTLDQTAALLSARDRYKRTIFADALAELERDPSLADVPSCPTVEQAAAGNCLITEALKPALRERILQQQDMPVPAAPAAAPPPVAVTPSPTTAPAAVPPAPPVAVAAARATPAVPRLELPARRPVRVAAVPQIQRKLALVIGVDNYADDRIPKLDNAINDATTVGQVFEKSLGYQTLVVRDGSKQAILAAFNQLAAVVSPSDSVVIYYAGHGELVEKTGLGYWQPASADASRPETWISNSDIGKLLGQLTASQVALISDSCFSGSLVSDERIRGVPVTGDPSALLGRRAAVVMSSGGNEPVSDSGKNGHSTFAWNLMRTIEKVSTWRPGSAVFEQVRFAVSKELPQRPQYGASRLGGHQTGSDYLFEQRQLDNSPR
jgi:filamentous hemagglutinin family protein